MKFYIVLLMTSVSLSLGLHAQSLSISVSSQTNVLINGQSTGSVTLSATGGVAPYQYSRDGINYQVSSTFNALAAGNYLFRVKDASYATATVSVTISQLSPLALYVISQNNVAVIGQNTGSVTLQAAGGKLPYQYSRDGINYQNSATFSSLSAGNYSFSVKDSLLSTVSVNVIISQSNVLSLGVTAQTNVAVIGQSTGAVNLAGAGGTPPYMFSKNGGQFQSSGSFGGLAAGTYIFTVRDAAFNTSSMSLLVTQPAPLALSVASKADVSINGQNTGSVTLSANGGTPPYQYSKDGGAFQASASFNSLAAGSYNFSVKDAAAATATFPVTITQADILVIKLENQVDVETYGKNTGSASFSASGGIAPYQFSKDGSVFQTTGTFTDLAAGEYTITLKDAAGALKTYTLVIAQPMFKTENIKAMNNFSPNNDGTNDKWIIEGVLDFPEHVLTIFDRGGRVVYKVRNYKNDWDGMVEGSNLAEGTYYYALTFAEAGIGTKKGFITLVR